MKFDKLRNILPGGPGTFLAISYSFPIAKNTQLVLRSPGACSWQFPTNFVQDSKDIAPGSSGDGP